MQHILVMNAKGGCGKTTLATNIASFYADQGDDVVLADYDSQGSSSDWLKIRPKKRPIIRGVEAWRIGLKGVRRGDEVVVMDAPARTHGAEITKILEHADKILVPVLPSLIDMKATKKFLTELRKSGRIRRRRAKIALVGNRVRDNTLIFEELEEFLDKQRLPYLGSLREAQNYVRAYTRGLGIFDLPEYLAWPDWDEWEPIIDWLEQ